MSGLKRLLLLLVILIIAACTGAVSVRDKRITDIQVSGKLSEHTREFRKEVIEVVPGIHVAVGFGLANAILVEGDKGTIIVDALETVEQARDVRAAFEKITPKPVKALIYTHNHTDHVFGAGAWADTHPDVYAHDTTAYYIDRLVNKMRPAVGTRSMRMFGTYLDRQGRVNAGIGPYLGINEHSTVALLRPNRTFSDRLDTTVAGVRLELVHAPGETNDQIFVYLPDRDILLCGDNFYHSFPNLYTIRGTPFRSLSQWVESLDRIREMRPAFLIPSHGRPIVGKERIHKVLTDYRDAIQYVHDQTIRGINRGLTPDELVETVKLPPHLAKAPYLQEYYGKVSWSVRAMFSGHLGWFDGNSSTLQPLAPEAQARMMVNLAGGEKRLLGYARKLSGSGQHQAALQLTDHLLRLDPGSHAVKSIRIKALTALGEREENANARHYYLTEAVEIRDGFVAREATKVRAETLAAFPLEGFFRLLRVNLDPVASADVDQRAGFFFADTKETYTVHVRRGVAEIRPRPMDGLDIEVVLDSNIWKEMLARIRHPATTLLTFDYKKGNAIALAGFLKLFSPLPQKLPYEAE